MKNTYSVGYKTVRLLKKAAIENNASQAELVSIERLSRFEAEEFDLARLERLAEIAKVTLPGKIIRGSETVHIDKWADKRRPNSKIRYER